LLATPLLALAGAPAWHAGVDVSIETAFGLKGGASTGETVHGTALAYFEWEGASDDTRTATWSGYASVLGVAGHGPTERFIGDFLAASNIEAHRSVRLYSWWFQTKRCEWSVRAGALLADEEFAGSDGAGGLLNSAFGWPAFISANTLNTGPAYFVSAPGLRVERTWSGIAAWRFGIYDGDSFDSPDGDPHATRHGLHYELGGAQGWFMISEIAFTIHDGRTRLKAGGWFHTATFADVLDDAFGQPFEMTGNDPREHGSNHGLYAAIERTLCGETGEPGNIGFFARIGFSPDDRNAVGHAFDAGLAWTGPIPGRSADVASIGIARAVFGARFAESTHIASPATAKPDHEQVVEASYTIQFSERLSVQPDFQYITHTGGTADGRDAVVFLLRVNSSF
jgi:porin